MAHVIEPALSGRSKCRGCERAIQKGELRLGERQPNPFGDGEMTIWFHLLCGAFKRPEVLIEALGSADVDGLEAESLRSVAEPGITHRRLPRVNGAERSPTGRARCRSCRELIDKASWRIKLVYFEMGRFQPSGYVHARCAEDYLETTDLIDRVRHFSPNLDPEDLAGFKHALE